MKISCHNLLPFLYFLLAKKDEGDEKDKEEEKGSGSAEPVVVLKLLNLVRPFTALKGVDIDALALRIINQLN
jgi:hypothetical protein